MEDNIELKVSKYDPRGGDDLVSQINLAPATARIRGKLITLDGDTQVTGYFWANAVSAHSIDANKLNVTSLSALTANFGTFTTNVSGKGSVTIKGSLIEVRDANGNLRVKMGVW